MEDHVHLLLSMPSDLTIAKAVNLLKSNSSKWMREEDRKFSWQEGYGAFSVSRSQIEVVTRYIERQRIHHRRFDFKTEFFGLLDKHGIEYDPKWVLG